MQAETAPLTARRHGPLQGRVRVPGDKSISHRALILGALTVGETRISGLLEGEDVLNTGKAVAALGAARRAVGGGEWRVHGVGVAGFATPGAARSISAIPAPGAGLCSEPWQAARSRRRSKAMPRCVGARCGGCSSRWNGSARVRWLLTEGRLPLTLKRRARADPDRVRADGSVGTAEVGRSPRRAFGAGRDGCRSKPRRRAITPKRCLRISAPICVVEPNGKPRPPHHARSVSRS